MRITGGIYGGRLLKAPTGRDVRPTSDKVRQAIFNILNARGLVEDANVLDVFCGTGALGLEALSWGASSCTFIDKSKASLDLCKENFAALKITTPTTFLLKDAVTPPPKPEAASPANLAFLDPPYKQGFITLSLIALVEKGWLVEDAHALIETEKGFAEPQWGFETLMERDYGDTRIALLKRAG